MNSQDQPMKAFGSEKKIQNRRQIYFFDDKPSPNNLWFTSTQQVLQVQPTADIHQKPFFEWTAAHGNWVQRALDVCFIPVPVHSEDEIRPSHQPTTFERSEIVVQHFEFLKAVADFIPVPIPVVKHFDFLKAVAEQIGSQISNGLFDPTVFPEMRPSEPDTFVNTGLKGEELDRLNQALDRDDVAGIVLDWDRVVSLTEGNYFSSISLEENLQHLNALFGMLRNLHTMGLFLDYGPAWTMDQYITYLLHDPMNPERIKQVSDVLQKAEQKGVFIYILTNNSGLHAHPDRKLLYLEIFNRGFKVNVPLRRFLSGGTNGPRHKPQTILGRIWNELDMRMKFPKREEGSTKGGGGGRQHSPNAGVKALRSTLHEAQGGGGGPQHGGGGPSTTSCFEEPPSFTMRKILSPPLPHPQL